MPWTYLYDIDVLLSPWLTQAQDEKSRDSKNETKQQINDIPNFL